MVSHFCLTIRYLQPFSHGRNEDGDPEWPPSPLRAFQALVAAAAGRSNERRRMSHAVAALRWLETLPPAEVVAAASLASRVKCQFYVPDNTADLLVPAWKRGDVTKQTKRTEKVVVPTHLGGEAVHYLYRLPDGSCPYFDVLTPAARGITHLGWGIDMVAGDASILSAEQAAALEGHRWHPTPVGGTPLRVPTHGTLDDLMRKHEAFLNRLSGNGFTPVPPLNVFRVCGYRRDDEPLPRPFRLFELRRSDGSRFRYPHRRFVHLAGMVRHLAIEAMKNAPPRGVPGNWVETYIAGHAGDDLPEHRQLSYLPLPSIGHPHADPGVRRIIIVAPPGDDHWLDHLARHLAGRVLEPLRGNEFAGDDPPMLVPIRQDPVGRRYTGSASAWATMTPVILPGHDDHKPLKTRKLIEKALRQSGVDQPCEFEWGAFSIFPKALSAHKYDRDKRPTGYIRPDHLLSQTAVHLTLRFNNGLNIPGPLVVGAGRHCGFGLMAPVAGGLT